MYKREKTFWSDDCQTRLSATFFEPEVNPVATIIIAHGIGEHIGRYEEFARFMTSKKIAVAGFDCIGHGRSTSKNKAPMYFGEEGSWEYLVKDFEVFYQILRDIYPNVPIFVMGFSMGSFVVRTAISRREINPTGTILVGTGTISELLSKMVKCFISQEAKKAGGDDKLSPKVNELAFGNYNKFFKPAKTEFDWLCENEEAIEEYISDELTRKFITPGMFRELLSGMAYANKTSTVKASDRNVPVLLLSGEKDPVGNFGKGVKKVEKLFKKYGFTTKSILYPNSRHDLLHDNHKKDVMNDIYDWMSNLM